MRALLFVLDSVGIGNAPDAAKYGDEGANTLGHILERVPKLQVSMLRSLGLPESVQMQGLEERRLPSYRASFGKMRERSASKDTTTRHWEIAAVIFDDPSLSMNAFPTNWSAQLSATPVSILSATTLAAGLRSWKSSARNIWKLAI